MNNGIKYLSGINVFTCAALLHAVGTSAFAEDEKAVPAANKQL